MQELILLSQLFDCVQIGKLEAHGLRRLNMHIFFLDVHLEAIDVYKIVVALVRIDALTSKPVSSQISR